MRLRDAVLAVVVNVLWGINFAVIDVGLGHLPPLLFCALRFAVAAVPAMFFVGGPRVAWRWVVAVGLSLGVVKFGLLFAGMAAGMPAGLSALVLQSQAIFTMMFAVALLRERPGARQVVGLAVAAGGIALVASGAGSSGTGTPRAFALVLGAGVAWGVANIAMRGSSSGARGGLDAVRFMVWVSAVAAPVDLALSLLIEGPRRDLAALALDPAGGFAIGYVAWVATLLGFGVWAALLRRYGAGRVAPFSMLAPVCAIAAGALLLGQPVHLTDVLGGAVVLAGILTGLLPHRTHRQPRDEEVGEWTDRHRVQQSADADRAAQQPAGRQHGDLDRGAYQPDRAAVPGHRAGHQPVPRAGSEPGADVQAGGQPADEYARHQVGGAQRERVRGGQQVDRFVHGEPDDHDVADRTHARQLAQRYPREQHQGADPDDHPAETQAGAAGQALVEDVPRVQAEPRLDHEGHAEPVEEQSRVQLEQPAR